MENTFLQIDGQFWVYMQAVLASESTACSESWCICLAPLSLCRFFVFYKGAKARLQWHEVRCDRPVQHLILLRLLVHWYSLTTALCTPPVSSNPLDALRCTPRQGLD